MLTSRQAINILSEEKYNNKHNQISDAVVYYNEKTFLYFTSALNSISSSFISLLDNVDINAEEGDLKNKEMLDKLSKSISVFSRILAQYEANRSGLIFVDPISLIKAIKNITSLKVILLSQRDIDYYYENELNKGVLRMVSIADIKINGIQHELRLVSSDFKFVSEEEIIEYNNQFDVEYSY